MTKTRCPHPEVWQQPLLSPGCTPTSPQPWAWVWALCQHVCHLCDGVGVGLQLPSASTGAHSQAPAAWSPSSPPGGWWEKGALRIPGHIPHFQDTHSKEGRKVPASSSTGAFTNCLQMFGPVRGSELFQTQLKACWPLLPFIFFPSYLQHPLHSPETSLQPVPCTTRAQFQLPLRKGEEGNGFVLTAPLCDLSGGALNLSQREGASGL